MRKSRLELAYELQRDSLLTAEQLVEKYAYLVRIVAMRFTCRGAPVEDLVQVGTIGLINAAKRFNPKLGRQFSSYADPTIEGQIHRWFRDSGWVMKVPRKLQETISKVRAISAKLAKKLYRDPTVTEIAEALGISEEDVGEAIMASTSCSILSLDQFVSGDLGDSLVKFNGSIGQECSEIADIVETADLWEAVDSLASKHQRAIICLYFWGQMRQPQIAESLGISQMQVSRLLKSALVHLRYCPCLNSRASLANR